MKYFMREAFVMNIQQNTIRVCKALILSYLVMLVTMLLTAVVLWKFDLGQGMLKAAVIVLYVLSAAAGGIYIGKMQKEKKFLWGLLTGCLFFLVLFILTMLSGESGGKIGMNFVSAFLICTLSGTLGGMLA